MSSRLRTLSAVAAGALVFFTVIFGLAYAAESVVKAGHLALLYGISTVATGDIYFETTKPGLIVSNGDRLSRFHLWCHTLSLVSLWVGACLIAFFGASACLGRIVKQQTNQ